MSSATSETGAAAPRHASTVVLSRDTDSGIEVYLLRRHNKVRFMGGLFVFPGGKLMEEDHDRSTLAQLVDPAPGRVVDAWQDELPDRLALGLAVAGIRETFEESGVLLGATNVNLDLSAMRAELLGGASFAALLAQGGVSLDLQVLFPLSRWITPALEPRRYDTRFYAAGLPEGQEASSDMQETTEGVWLRPVEALARVQQGDLAMAPPTIRTLMDLMVHDQVAAACHASLQRDPPKVLPIIRQSDGAFEIIYPGDPEHPDPTPAWEGPTREILKPKARHVGK